MKKPTKQETPLQIGKLIKGIDSLLLPEDAISDCENLIPTHKGWKQRKGQSELTTSAIAASLEIKSGIHFQQLNLAANEIIAHAYDSVNGERIMRQTTLPPSTHAGNTWEALKTLTAGCEVAQFAQVGDALIMANDKEFQIYRGSSHKPTGVFKYINAQSLYVNFFDEMTDEDTSTSMSMNSFATADYLTILGDQPLQGFTPTVGNTNSNTGWMIVEYWNGVWTILKQASWWSSDSVAEYDCSTLTGWTDVDAVNGESTQTTLDGREVFKLDSGVAAGGTFAQLSRDAGTIGDTGSMSVLVYHDAIGTRANSDGFKISVAGGGVQCLVNICSDDLYIYDGASWNAQSVTVPQDEWVLWTIVADFSTPASASADIYRNGIQVVTGADCSYLAGTSGTIYVRQEGTTTSNRITYVAQITVGTSLDTTGDSFVDGTSSGGVTLAQDGSVTWTAPGGETKALIEGIPGFAYRVSFSAALDASVTLTGMTIDSPWGDVKNIWSGEYIPCVGCKVMASSVYTDYSGKINNDYESDYADLSSFDTDEEFLLGFDEQTNVALIDIPPTKGNATGSVITLKYFQNDGTWSSGFTVAAGTLEDTTSVGGACLQQSGFLKWEAPTDEKPTRLGGDLVPLYWYKITVSVQLDAEVQVFQVQGTPVSEDPKACFGVTAFKRRAVQIAPKGNKNVLRLSAAELPNTFNGSDSTYVYFGERPLKAATQFFNELLVLADHEIWMMQGDRPSTYGKLRLSALVGIDAPASLISIETGVLVGTGASANIRKIVAWFYKGIWFFDGLRWWIVSAPDIDNFFDPDHDDYINPTYANRTYGGFDFETQCAYWIVYSGSSQTTPNKVIVLHPPTMWYGIFSYNMPISCLLRVINNNRQYLCAGGHSSGKLYRLNDTNTDVDSSGTAVAIEAFMITKDIWAAYDVGLKERLIAHTCKAQDGGRIDLSIFPDASKTPQELGSFSMIERGKSVAKDFIKAQKGWPGAISFKFKLANSTKNVSWTPYGLKVNWDIQRADNE